MKKAFLCLEYLLWHCCWKLASKPKKVSFLDSLMVISSERLVERIERLLERMLLMRARLLERTLTWSHTYMITSLQERTLRWAHAFEKIGSKFYFVTFMFCWFMRQNVTKFWVGIRVRNPSPFGIVRIEFQWEVAAVEEKAIPFHAASTLLLSSSSSSSSSSLFLTLIIHD